MTHDVWSKWTMGALTERARGHEGFQAIDWHLATFCAEGERDPACQCAVFVVTAIVSRALREGHPCILLDDVARGPWVTGWLDGTGLTEATAALPHLLKEAHSVTMLTDSPTAAVVADVPLSSPQASLADSPTDASMTRVPTPLVFDAERRVYLTRYYLHERRLAKSLERLITVNLPHEVSLSWMSGRLEHYFPSRVDQDGQDLQREAARNAILSRVLVVSGGPGTGKTATVVKILALLVEEAATLVQPYPRIALLAPTGKAAARLNESIRSALALLDLPAATREAMEPHAMTIHRALGVRADSATRFVRGSSYPLVADVVVVDEGSMVDLALMRHLCEALSPTARLIILGDRYQLASVEAGSVFSDLCEALMQTQAQRSGRAVAVTELTRSYRFKQDSGIAALAESVRRGAWQGFLQARDSRFSDVSFYGAIDDRLALRALLETAERFWSEAFLAATPAQALARFARFRVLCAHREGAFGVHSVNQSIAHHLFERGHLTSSAQLSRGHLMMVLENDAALGISNGDVFVVWPDDEGRLWAWFLVAEQQVRRISIPQLPRHEPCFAMTIHKSQGSEFGAVALVLPAAGSPILTRELLYTGITRAKEQVYIYADDPTLQEAVHRSTVRRSGLGRLLLRNLIMLSGLAPK